MKNYLIGYLYLTLITCIDQASDSKFRSIKDLIPCMRLEVMCRRDSTEYSIGTKLDMNLLIIEGANN